MVGYIDYRFKLKLLKKIKLKGVLKMKKINCLTDGIIREKGQKNDEWGNLEQYDIKATLNYNSNDRFFISNQELIRYIKTKKIRSITKKIKLDNKTISRGKISSEYNEKIHLYSSSFNVLQFDFKCAQLDFKYNENCYFNISIDKMGWVDILIYKKLSDNLKEVLHIVLDTKEGQKNNE